MVDNFRKDLEEISSNEDIRQAFRIEEASSDEDIGQAFKIEEALIELDTKLGDFAETWIEVDNYRQKVKEKY